MLCDLTRPLGRISRSICPENLTGEPGKGGATPLEQGSAYAAAKNLGIGWKVNPYIVVGAGETITCRYQGHGHDQSYLVYGDEKMAQLHSADLLGRSGDSQCGMPHRRLLLHGMAAVYADQLPCSLCQPPQCAELLLGYAFPKESSIHPGKPCRGRDDYLLSDRLLPDGDS